jgi:hypothetical protein
MAIFKDPNLPAAIRNNYIADTEMVVKSIENYKRSLGRVSGVFSSFIDFLFSFNVIIIEKILKGDFDKKYLKLAENIDSLMNNELYYLSAKIKQSIE